MARRTRSRRPLMAAGLTALATGAALLAAPPSPAQAADIPSVTVRPDPSYQQQPFEGWGTSLAWFANVTGGYPQQIRDKLAALLFDDDGLGLNIARYNIGGGNAPDVKDYLRAGGAVQGWWKAPAGTTREDTGWWSADDPADWNDRADATQRWWVDRIKKDITHWETFSNSPPWFMTASGYVSGGFDATADQLKAGSVNDYAAYLAGATQRLEKAHGIKVTTVDPFNEPNTPYWSTRLGTDGQPVGGRQEGAHMSPGLQRTVLRALAPALHKAGTQARISAMDETNPSTFAQNWSAYTAQDRALVGQMNVHTYGTGQRTTVRDLAKAAGKNLWMSEVEGDWGDGQSFTDMRPGLGLAQHIVDDLRELEPRAWVFWQPVEDYDNMKPGGESARGGNWGEIQIPFSCTSVDTLATCPIRTNTKFDTARNFTHFIQPGDRLIKVDDTSSAAAVTKDGRGASLVHVNSTTAPRSVTLDLSKFRTISRGATVTPVVTSADGKLAVQRAIGVTGGRATFTVPAQSVTTFVVKGVSGAAENAPLLRQGHTYTLTGVQSGKAATRAPGGSGLVIGASTGTPAQQWKLSQVRPGGASTARYVFTSAVDGRRLAVRDNAPVTEPDTGRRDAATEWLASTTGDGTWTLVNAATGRLLEVGGQATGEGAAVTTWPPNSGPNQRWTLTDVTPDGSTAAQEGTAGFRGVNWADPRDNYADDPVVLSGLSTSDDYARTYTKASRVIAAFRANLGANTVRLPINPYTVNGPYWTAYRGVIDAATRQGFKVIVSYWEGTGARKDGLIDDPEAFRTMWDTVVRAYGDTPGVYFEPMNEPHGYTDAQWADIAANWLARYPSVPRERVFVSGAGYNDHVTTVCADPRLRGTRLSLHHYGFWKSYATYDQWVADLKARIGDCAARTVADEFGAPMTTGLDYDRPDPSDNFVNYLQAVTDTFRELGMGSVYWPGLRTGDTYTLQTLTGDPERPWLATTNRSGADRLAWAWGRGAPVQH